MATQPTTSMDDAHRRDGSRTLRAIVALVVVTLLVSVVGSTSVAHALARVAAVGTGVGIVAMCCVGWYLIGLAARDGAARQFGHAWRDRRH
jgi:hypothetical protein